MTKDKVKDKNDEASETISDAYPDNFYNIGKSELLSSHDSYKLLGKGISKTINRKEWIEQLKLNNTWLHNACSFWMLSDNVTKINTNRIADTLTISDSVADHEKYTIHLLLSMLLENEYSSHFFTSSLLMLPGEVTHSLTTILDTCKVLVGPASTSKDDAHIVINYVNSFIIPNSKFNGDTIKAALQLDGYLLALLGIDNLMGDCSSRLDDSKYRLRKAMRKYGSIVLSFVRTGKFDKILFVDALSDLRSSCHECMCALSSQIVKNSDRIINDGLLANSGTCFADFETMFYNAVKLENPFILPW